MHKGTVWLTALDVLETSSNNLITLLGMELRNMAILGRVVLLFSLSLHAIQNVDWTQKKVNAIFL